MFKLSLTARVVRNSVREKRAAMLRMAFAWCNDRNLAEDLVQESMTRAMEKSHQLKKIESVNPWVYRILYNCWLEHLRTRKPEDELSNESISSRECPEQRHETDMIGQIVRRAVSRLPHDQREVLTLVDLEALTYREVAEILDIPMGTVMSRLSRARKNLERELMPMRIHPEPAKNHLRRVK